MNMSVQLELELFDFNCAIEPCSFSWVFQKGVFAYILGVIVELVHDEFKFLNWCL